MRRQESGWYLGRVTELLVRRRVALPQSSGGQSQAVAVAVAAAFAVVVVVVVMGARAPGGGGGSQAGLDEVLEDGHEEEHGDEDGRGREPE